MSSEPLIRELESSNYEALARFNAAFPGDLLNETKWLDRFHYWWDYNPAYSDDWKRGFLLLERDEIVGFVGSFPSFLQAGEQIVKAFNGTTWRVLENYRKYSIDLWSYNREVSKHYFSFNTTPTDDVIKMIKRLKYFKVPWGAEKYSYLIGNHLLFSDKLPRKIPKAFKICISQALKKYQNLRLWRIKPDYQVKILSDDLSSVETLWQRTKHQYEYTNIRDAQSMQWYQKGKILKGIFENDKLLATAIYVQSSPLSGKMNLNLADFWYDHQKPLDKLIQALLHHDANNLIKEKQFQMIRYPHFSPSISNVLNKSQSFSHIRSYPGYIRIPNGMKVSMDVKNSYFGLLQGDFGA